MATYDPSKNYTWDADTVFEMSGQEFGLILNALRGILSTKEATNTIIAYEANKKVEGIIARAVEQDVIHESAVPEQQPMQVVKEEPQVKEKRVKAKS